jgi:hypothetical protein
MESEGIQPVALVCLVYLVFLIGLVERDQSDELDKLIHGSGRLGLADHEPALFMTVRREIAEPRRETSARSREDPMRTRVVR